MFNESLGLVNELNYGNFAKKCRNFHFTFSQTLTPDPPVAKRRKKKSGTREKFSPSKYLRTKARTFPLEHCYCNEAFEVHGLAQVLVVRKQPSGKLLCGVYLVDVFCLGLKDTFFELNLEQADLDELLSRFETQTPLVPKPYDWVHNLVYGAIAYARDLGFEPSADFRLTKFILEEDTEQIPFQEFTFGRQGRPTFIPGPYDDAKRVERTLNQSVGAGNWDMDIA